MKFRPSAPPPSDHRSVLVVEDDTDLREVLEETLTLSGYSVRSASNGQEALEELYRHPPPSLILLDLMMPTMSGEDFRRKQLEDDALARVPVALITGRFDGPARAQSMGLPCLPKPVTCDNLLELVAKYSGPAKSSFPPANNA